MIPCEIDPRAVELGGRILSGESAKLNVTELQMKHGFFYTIWLQIPKLQEVKGPRNHDE